MASELILIVDDEEGIRESLSDILEDEGYKVMTASTGEEAVEALRRETPDLVFLDVWLPGIDGIETLEQMRALVPDLTILMISGHGNIETALKATRSGAYDFLEKPLSLERVVLTARRALEKQTLKRENIHLKQCLGKKLTLVGESPGMSRVKNQVAMAAKSNSRVLITGESGTGKEIVAHLLHELSPRAEKTFIELNCAAIPQELIESELFGHEKGSFTGAFEMKKGKFELAHEGTLFLDEIGDMSFQTQAKLLRVLESQEIQRVGGSRSIRVDVRVIAATNKDLPEMIHGGRFRDDLYFRLNVIPIQMPPLRERKEDIPLLVKHFLEMIACECKQPTKTISDQALKDLIGHDWPGNIRELKNLIERLVIMTPREHIEDAGLTKVAQVSVQGSSTPKSLKDARDAFEKGFIIQRLIENNWNVSRTAEALELERSNLHKKIKAYGIAVPE